MNTDHIPLLGITGGIGSGKSSALAYLRQLGAAVISSDDIVHELLAEPAVIAQIVGRFGERAAPAGVVDRAALARVVFDDVEELAWLENLLHPHVKRVIAEWAAGQTRADGAPALLAVEVPLLFESDMEGFFDHVLLVTAPEDVRRKRLAAKLTESEFSRRVARQLDEEAKAARSDFVFHNSGSRRRLKGRMSEIFATIIAGDASRSRQGS